MKLRAANIVLDAVSRALDDAIPGAVRRWYKHRPRCAASTLLEAREFQDHLRDEAYGAVCEGLGNVLDLYSEADSDEVLVKTDAAIVVYQGAGGWRWIIVDDGSRTFASSPTFATRARAMEDATALAGITNLAVEVSGQHPETT